MTDEPLDSTPTIDSEAPTDVIPPRSGYPADTTSATSTRVHLRKRLETAPVSLDVALQREIARVVRQPLGLPVTQHKFNDEELEIALRGQEPLVYTEVVQAESVTLESDEQSVRATVRSTGSRPQIGLADLGSGRDTRPA